MSIYFYAELDYLAPITALFHWCSQNHSVIKTLLKQCDYSRICAVVVVLVCVNPGCRVNIACVVSPSSLVPQPKMSCHAFVYCNCTLSVLLLRPWNIRFIRHQRISSLYAIIQLRANRPNKVSSETCSWSHVAIVSKKKSHFASTSSFQALTPLASITAITVSLHGRARSGARVTS